MSYKIDKRFLPVIEPGTIRCKSGVLTVALPNPWNRIDGQKFHGIERKRNRNDSNFFT